MAGLEGTVKTPFGAVQKKTALLVGGGAVVLGAIVWYRQKQSGDTADALAPTEAAINPATGYPYGSAEDAAALAAQAGYQSPAGNDPTGGGSGNIPPSNIGYASNGQWVQGVIQFMLGNDLVSDPSALSSALGKYITGAYASDADRNLIQQAIAAQGFPPISGPNGYPPSLNTTPPVVTPPVTAPKPTGSRGYGWYKAVKGDNITKVTKKYNITSAQFIAWNGADALRVGEWIKVRANSNPLVGYNGIK